MFSQPCKILRMREVKVEVKELVKELVEVKTVHVEVEVEDG